MSSNDTDDAQIGRLHVCDDCDWAGDGHAAVGVVGPNAPTFRCPDCDGETHREYFGNPLPDKGETW